MASATELRKRITGSLLEDINEVQYPSVTMMNRVESTLSTREDLAEYADVLIKKVEASQYPSISMLNRLDGLLDNLEQLERREQAQAAAEDDADRD